MFLIALTLFTLDPPDRWVHVGGSANDFVEYLDVGSVSRAGSKVTLWTRRDFPLGQGTAWNELEFDCSRRTKTILAYVRDNGGTISHNVVRPHRDASSISRNSVEEKVFNIAFR